MLLGFNMLLWSTHVTEEHFPLLADIKRAGYDGVEIPIFEGAPEHFAKVGRAVRDNGLRATAVTVMPDAAHDCTSSDPSIQAAALEHITWAVDCLTAAGGETLCGPFHQPLGVFSGDPPTAAERANVVSVHKKAAAYAARHNVKLSIEPLNRFECYVLNTVDDAAEVVRAVNAPNYGLLYDTFHSNIEEKDPVGVIAPNLSFNQPCAYLGKRSRHAGQGACAMVRDHAGAEAGRLRRLVRDRGFRPRPPGPGGGDARLARFLPQPRGGLPASATTSCANNGPRRERPMGSRLSAKIRQKEKDQ